MSKERFSVSADGLRQLNAGRAPWSLVKELVQNAWDEAPNATMCDVTITPESEKTTVITVTDDGPGFADITHAWTLMADTPKRTDPAKRGRFNLGEKEIIAVAESAEIETVGTTIRFPLEGGRETKPNRRSRGTRITLTMPWTPEQAEEIQQQLHRFRPTDCSLTVDGKTVPRRKPLASRTATLRTVLQRGPGQPITDTRRKTTVDVLERAAKASAWIYEMGIPIQATTLPYDIDVHQKVPMPPNRNTVSAGYLQDIMTEVLNAMHGRMEPDAFSENWVRTAVEDDRAEDATVESVKKHRYGAKTVMWSSDTDANMRAAEAGYQVIHPKAMSAKERMVMTHRAGMKSAKTEFGRPPETRSPDESNDVRLAFAHWVREISLILGLKTSVRYVSAPSATFIAQCSAASARPRVTINTHFCPDDWLADRGPEQLDLILHELAHALADTPMEHGPKWGEAGTLAGAKIAHAIADGKLVYTPKTTSKTTHRHLIGLPSQPAG